MDKILMFLFFIECLCIFFFFDTRIVEGFSIPKAVFLYIFSSFLAILLFYFYLSRKIKIFKSGILLIIFLFLILVFLSCSLAPYKNLAFLGSYGRLDGFLSFFCYFLNLLLVLAICQKRNNIWILSFFFIICGFLLSIYGLYQYFFAPAESWEKAVFLGRVVSSLGNPVFLGLFLVMTLPLNIVLVFITKNIYKKIFLILTFLVQFWCLYLTLSRGCLLAFFISSCVFLFLLQDYFKKYLKEILICALGCILLFFYYTFKPQVSYVKRFQEVITKQEEGVKPGGPLENRKAILKSYINGIKDNLFFGVGLENFGELFSIYKSKDYFILNGQYASADRAHNIFFETLITTGILGFLCFCIFWLNIFVCFLKTKRDILNCGFFCAFLGYLIQCQFNFPEAAGYLLFFSLVGLFASNSMHIQRKRIFLGKFFRKFCFLLIPFSVAFFIFCCIWSLKLYLADSFYKKAIIASQRGDLKEAFFNYQKAMKLNPFCQRYYGIFAEEMIKLTKNPILIEEALKKLDIALGYYPQNSIFWNLKGMGFYYLYEEKKDKNLLKKAIICFKNAIKYDRFFVDAYNNLGACYYLKKEYKKAKELFKQVVKLQDISLPLEVETSKIKLIKELSQLCKG